jgi:hypothetical protein
MEDSARFCLMQRAGAVWERWECERDSPGIELDGRSNEQSRVSYLPSTTIEVRSHIMTCRWSPRRERSSVLVGRRRPTLSGVRECDRVYVWNNIVFEYVDDGACISAVHLELKVADVGLDIASWLWPNFSVSCHGRTERFSAGPRGQGLRDESKEWIGSENNEQSDSCNLDIYANVEVC